MTDPARLAGWPKLLAQLDDDQYEALSLTFNAMMSGRLTAEELNEFATGAMWAGMIEDVETYHDPPG